ncbi:hypothetical protein Ahy_A06g028097 isoform B [Arachis hypogaea]|uniref:Uncharacterized protein n=1 Tax=Arachis hypogaea TaxID=3818 RepID=A0A445CQI6_ARAHY|nr:hypothetical protein Ahy_A06g028097 isoform B [Arachis hypogaea]
MSRCRYTLSPCCRRLELAAELLHRLQAVASLLISSSPSPLITMVISSVTNSVMETKLNCCEECASNYEKKSQFLRPGHKKTLPLWLQPHTTETNHQKLKRKWNRLCQCLHQTKQEAQDYWSNNNSWNAKSYTFNNNSSSSVSFTDKPTPIHNSNLVPRFRRQNSCTIEFNFSDKRQATTEPVLGSMELLEVTTTCIELCVSWFTVAAHYRAHQVSDESKHRSLTSERVIEGESSSSIEKHLIILII